MGSSDLPELMNQCHGYFGPCFCNLPAGHEPPHKCWASALGVDICQGHWTGSEEDGTAVAVVFADGTTIDELRELFGGRVTGVFPTSAMMPTEPQATVDVTVLVQHEDDDAGEQAEVGTKPGPEPVPVAAGVVSASDVQEPIPHQG